MRSSSSTFAALTRAVFALVVVGAANAACIATKAETDSLRQDMDALKSETAQMQRQVTDEREQSKQRLAAMEARVVELQGTLSSIRQADADVGVQLEKVIAEVQTLRGEIEQARYELGETSKTVQGILERPPVSVAAAAEAPKLDEGKGTTIAGAEVPAEPKEHYAFAKKLYDDKKYAEAAEAFELYLQRHPRGPEADNAVFWKAESFYGTAGTLSDAKAKEKAYKQAILAYQRVLESPKSAKADGALFKIGLCFENLGFKDEARVFYEELLQKHKDSPLANDAKKRLKSLGPAKKKKGK
jgi:TolA-binding protein